MEGVWRRGRSNEEAKRMWGGGERVGVENLWESEDVRGGDEGINRNEKTRGW